MAHRCLVLAALTSGTTAFPFWPTNASTNASHQQRVITHRYLLRDGKEPELIGMINAFRAEMCAHQIPGASKAYTDCDVFMTEHCNPGPDRLMNGDPGERTTGGGFCHDFFNKAQKKEEPEVVPVKEEHHHHEEHRHHEEAHHKETHQKETHHHHHGGPAADTNHNCGSWAAAGQCSSNPDFMLKECATSCETPAGGHHHLRDETPDLDGGDGDESNSTYAPVAQPLDASSDLESLPAHDPDAGAIGHLEHHKEPVNPALEDEEVDWARDSNPPNRSDGHRHMDRNRIGEDGNHNFEPRRMPRPKAKRVGAWDMYEETTPPPPIRAEPTYRSTAGAIGLCLALLAPLAVTV